MDIESLLLDAMNKLDDLNIRAHEELDELEKDKRKYYESNKETLNIDDDMNDTIRMINRIDALEKNMPKIEKIGKIRYDLTWHIVRVEGLLNFKPNSSNIGDFLCRLDQLEAIPTEKFLTDLESAIKILPVTNKDILSVNNKFDESKKIFDRVIKNGITYYNFVKVVKRIQEILGPTLQTLNKIIRSLETEEIRLKNPKNLDAEFEEKSEQFKKRKKEVDDHLAEFDRKIELAKKNISEIEATYALYDEYMRTKSQDKLNALKVKLIAFKVISPREIKLTEFRKEEKTKETISEKIEKPVIETPSETKTESTKEIDSDYFRRPDTKRIICFLGDENSIMEDIDYYFDKSMKVKALDKLCSIFNILSSSRDYISRAGGDPSGATSKKTLTLLGTPYNFTYRRYGEGVDKFRFHAIKRHSDLLEKLGYGEGNIIFFGSVGPNDDNEKKFAYDRLGSRAVDVIGNKKIKLQPTFDYIEHITRGYIPVSLLSPGDKEKVNKGEFNNMAKGNIPKSIEHSKYISFDFIDDTSKANVKKWLDDYFIEQTNKLFEIKDMYKNLKGNSLD